MTAIVNSHVLRTVYNPVQKNVAVVVAFATHVFLCVSEYVLLNAKLDVHHVQINVDGGVMFHVMKSAYPTVTHHAYHHALDLVLQE